MNTKLTLTVLAAMAIVQASATTVPATLSNAVVYPNGAELFHYADVNLKRGENEVVLQGLSPEADNTTLRITLEGDICLVTHAFRTELIPAEQEAPSIRELRTALQSAEQQQKQLNKQMEVLRTMQTLLANGVSQNLSAEQQKVSTAMIDAGIHYYQQRAMELHQQQLDIAAQCEELQKTIAHLRAQLEVATSGNAQSTGVLAMRINAPQDGKTTIRLHYYTHSASWQPIYDATLASHNAPLVIAAKANVRQRTGIDWDNVLLTLSTAQPTHYTAAPDPQQWSIRKIEPVYGYANTMARKSMFVGSAMAMPEMESMDAMADEVAGVSATPAPVWDGREFAVPTPYTIPSTGKDQVVLLDTYTLSDVSLDWYTLPQVNSTVYLRARIPNIGQLHLLPGTTSISYNGTYYGKQYVNFASAEEDFHLTIGEEPRITVKRERVEDFTQSRRLTSKTTTTTLYRITLHNNLSEQATVILKEAYPISTNKEIEVALHSKTTPCPSIGTDKTDGATVGNDTEKGILTYEVSLQPNESKDIYIGYDITYPKDWTINLR